MDERIVVAYHGTSVAAAAQICADQRMVQSRNDWDWLGWGSYFWEDGLHRAWEWARELFGDQAAVVSVPVRLGKCLNLCDGHQHPVVRTAHEMLKNEHARMDAELPANKSNLQRPLDCLVLNFVCEVLVSDIDTVRASFQEGEPIYPGAGFHEFAHVHLCVKQDTAFVGPFKLEDWG